jgi:predicted AAA+ superfamily ATPase
METLKARTRYLQELLLFKDKAPVKVITGVRRCGKSTLLDLLEAHLLDSGVPQKRIIRMNFESLEWASIQNASALFAAVKAALQKQGMNYVLLDEVQFVPEWEKAVNSLRLLKNTDLYITGSNAKLLASEIATQLSGRFVEIKMLPLSFREFLDFQAVPPEGDLSGHFQKYLEAGGFPGAIDFLDSDRSVRLLLDGIYNTVLLKDVVERNAVRDPDLLEAVARYLCANVGNLVSTKKISDYLTSAGRKTNSETIDNYVRMLEAAFFFYRARRFDLRGKLHLKTQEKFYLVDLGIRSTVLGIQGDYGFLIENVVYFELLRRGFEVSIGKLGDLEIDFVATKSRKRIYIQVCASLLDPGTRERELKPLFAIPDHHEKWVISMDKIGPADFDGVRNVNLLEWLVEVLA